MLSKVDSEANVAPRGVNLDVCVGCVQYHIDKYIEDMFGIDEETGVLQSKHLLIENRSEVYSLWCLLWTNRERDV